MGFDTPITDFHEPFGGVVWSGTPDAPEIKDFIYGQTLDDDRWMIVLAFRVGHGATDLVAHLVLPTPDVWAGNDNDKIGWLGTLHGTLRIGATPGRLTNSLVRLSTTPFERWARRKIVAAEGWVIAPGTAGSEDRPRGPRPGDRERTLVKLAAEYVDLYRVGDPTPVKTLAERRHLAHTTVTGYLHDARTKYGLLEANGQGQAGGSLTPKANALLDVIRHEQEAAS